MMASTIWKGAGLTMLALCPAAVQGQPADCRHEAVRLDVTRTLRIGTATGAEAYTFAEIGDVAVTGDGTIWVLDAAAAQLRSYEAQGKHRLSVGGEGEGPGEFRRPLHLSTSDSSVTVMDAALHRETEYGFDGERLRADRLPGVPGLNVTYRRVLSDGRVIVVTTPRLSYGSEHHEPHKIIALLRYEGDVVTTVDTLAAFHSGATIYHPPNRSLPWGAMAADFGPEGARAVSPDEEVVLIDGYEGTATVLTGRPDGSLTVTDESERCREIWTVVDFNTNRARRVRLPDGFRLRFLRCGRLYGTSRGPFGSPRVDVYEPTTSSPSGDSR